MKTDISHMQSPFYVFFFSLRRAKERKQKLEHIKQIRKKKQYIW